MSRIRLALVLSATLSVVAASQGPSDSTRRPPRDPMQEGLPLRPDRVAAWTTKVGHWMSVDVSPDGSTLVFDLLGDLYTMPIAGGKATVLTQGMAVDVQPRFSPDGKKVVFVSDRDGGWNLWTISLDKKDTAQITRGKTNNYISPEWTPDGKYIVSTRGAKLWMFHAEGGTGSQLIRQQLGPGQPDLVNQRGVAFGKDGRYVWFAQRNGQWIYNTPGGDYQLAVYDRESGQTSSRSNREGSAFRPTLSPDGKWLVYVSRHIDSTRLRIRELDTGNERWLIMKVSRDDQESAATLDAYPGMSFTPDSKSLVAWWDGKLWKVPVEGGAPTEIPFEVDVKQALGPNVHFDYPISDSATFVIKQIRDAVPSPDGKKLAFVALDRLYTMDFSSCATMTGTVTTSCGTPQRVTDMDVGEFEPAWSPDGKWLAYTTWTNAGPNSDGAGFLYKVSVEPKGRPVRVTTKSGLYQNPVWSKDGKRIVAIRGPQRAYEEALQGGVPGGAEDIIWVNAAGGDANFIAPAGGLGSPHFASDSNRIYLYSGGRGLVSMRWDGTDPKTHIRVVGPRPPGPPNPNNPNAGGPPALLVQMAPTGDQAMAQVSNDIYIVTVPVLGGQEPTIDVGSTEGATFPMRKLSDIGGQFPAWSADAKKVHWSVGNAHVVYDLDRGRAFDDSVRKSGQASGQGGDSAQARPARRGPPPAFKPLEFRIRIAATRDIPKGTAVLRGARVITMNGDEVIENADVIVRDNRIAAVGARGSVNVPADAKVIDVAGKTIMPGFVDTHAHLRGIFNIHRTQVWPFAANLAYGVTTVRDPQTSTTDVLSYEDEVVAGQILGPRIYSTGPGVFGAGSPTGQNLRDLDHARSVLKRYSDYYDTKTIKQYVVGNREQRQWVIQAARELHLMPTTEGALDIKMNLSEAIDGYSGHEHTIPTYPLSADVIRLLAESKIVYTPTIIVAYGGPWAENYWYDTQDLVNDAKLKHFTPWNDLEGKILRRGGSLGGGVGGVPAGWFHESQHIMKPVSNTLADLVAAGGHIGVGSHGQLQGLGYHWELWNMAFGRLSARDALRAATIMGADAIGLAKDVGSIEVGKEADLLVMDANPLENIRNTKTLRWVMKNGRLYDASTLDEIYPREKKAERFYWLADGMN